MFIGTVSVDFNGIVLFDPGLLKQYYRGVIEEGTDLFTKYTTTEEGDIVLARGLIVPILAIDDAGYDIVIRLESEQMPEQKPVIVENGIYPLHIGKRLIIADLAVLSEWAEEEGWQDVDMPEGLYAVTIKGFRELDVSGKRIISAGYEFILESRDTLPEFTADLAKNMRVLRLDI
ncbi:MAG: hypothetical protein ACUVWN_10780 [bacterium]